MADDYFKSKGQAKWALPTAGKATVIPMPVFGIVKDNNDSTRQGAIRVYLPDFGSVNSNDSKNWRTVYPVGFYGKTPGTPPDSGFGTYKTNPASYGVWHSPPDIGTKVICVFVNGDTNFGYYLGGVYDPDALHMVPAIAGTEKVLMNEGEANSYGGAVRLPVTNINNNSSNAASLTNYLDAPKPVHSFAAATLNKQGLIRDPIRGVISSSAQRENSSRVGWGVSTPGRPIYNGGFTDEGIFDQLNFDTPGKQFKVVSRRAGHTFVMDDGDLIGRNQLIRLRSAAGHQITMSDDGQTMFIIHANGQTYIELGKEGTVDIYATNSFNVRTQGDVNLHADRDVNIHAGRNLNLRAENDISVQTDNNFKLKVLKDYTESVIGSLKSLVGQAYAVASGGQASMMSAAEAFVNGTKVNLNSGDPATTPEMVEDQTVYVQSDTLYDSDKGFIAAPGKLNSITSRAPAHAPWANAGQGVDVQVDLGSDVNFPEAPSAAVSDTNAAAAATTGENQTPSPSDSAVQPPSAGGALGQNTASSVLGSVAKDTVNNPLTNAAATAGAGIIKKVGG